MVPDTLKQRTQDKVQKPGNVPFLLTPVSPTPGTDLSSQEIMKVCCTNEQEGRLIRTGRKGPGAVTQELLLMRGLCGPEEGRLAFHDVS